MYASYHFSQFILWCHLLFVSSIHLPFVVDERSRGRSMCVEGWMGGTVVVKLSHLDVSRWLSAWTFEVQFEILSAVVRLVTKEISYSNDAPKSIEKLSGRRGQEGGVCFCWLIAQHPSNLQYSLGMVLLWELYVLPYWDRGYRSNLLYHAVTGYWQPASIAQRWPCSESYMFSHTEIEFADQTCYITQLEDTDTRPPSCRMDPVTQIPGRAAIRVLICKSLICRHGNWPRIRGFPLEKKCPPPQNKTVHSKLECNGFTPS